MDASCINVEYYSTMWDAMSVHMTFALEDYDCLKSDLVNISTYDAKWKSIQTVGRMSLKPEASVSNIMGGWKKWRHARCDISDPNQPTKIDPCHDAYSEGKYRDMCAHRLCYTFWERWKSCAIPVNFLGAQGVAYVEPRENLALLPIQIFSRQPEKEQKYCREKIHVKAKCWIK